MRADPIDETGELRWDDGEEGDRFAVENCRVEAVEWMVGRGEEDEGGIGQDGADDHHFSGDVGCREGAHHHGILTDFEEVKRSLRGKNEVGAGERNLFRGACRA